MQSIENKVITRIKKCGRGQMLFPSDFMRLGEPKSVQKAFENLTKNGTLIRVARGIYCYPKVETKLGLGVIYPTLEEIAQTIARRDKIRIAPTGIYAMNRLGLSTQVVMNAVFYTDGSSRKIHIAENKTIQFKHVVPKKLAFKNELPMLIVFALQEITAEHFTAEHLTKLKRVLASVPKDHILEDAALIPAWIRTIIEKCYE